jgi:Ca-activated chloride channel homolog
MPRPALLAWVLVVAACSKDSQPAGTQAATSSPSPSGQVVLSVVYGSEKKTWLEEQAKAFQATGPKTKGGRAIVVKTQPMGSGEATQGSSPGR